MRGRRKRQEAALHFDVASSNLTSTGGHLVHAEREPFVLPQQPVPTRNAEDMTKFGGNDRNLEQPVRTVVPEARYVRGWVVQLPQTLGLPDLVPPMIIIQPKKLPRCGFKRLSKITKRAEVP